MFKIRDIMTSPVFTSTPDMSVLKAAEYMHKHSIGGLPVLENNKLVGIITSKDLYLSHTNRIVADTMTKTVVYCSPDDTVWEANEELIKNKIERLPVLNNGDLIGIITKTQIIKAISQLTDPLTGLYNSAYIYLIISNLFKKSHEISVLLFDINEFGQINKRIGHVYGDKCIILVSEIIKENTNNELDYLCRYGGDEFVIVTVRGIKEAEILAQSIIDKIATTPYEGITITVTAGICGGKRRVARTTNNHFKTAENLINKASLASTKAKETKLKYIIT